MKACIACGMPLEKTEDFAQGDSAKAYCRYCAREDGTMQSYDEKLASMTEFIVRSQGLAATAAREAAKAMLARLPAWRGQKP